MAPVPDVFRGVHRLHFAYSYFVNFAFGKINVNIISRRIRGRCNGFNTFRDVDHPGKDMGALYAQDVKNICEKLKSKGMKPGCFIAESLQSCGGNIRIIDLDGIYFVCLLSNFPSCIFFVLLRHQFFLNCI